MFGEGKCIFWRRRKRKMEKEKNMTEKENISTMDRRKDGTSKVL